MSNRKTTRQHSYARCGECGTPISKSEFHMNEGLCSSCAGR